MVEWLYLVFFSSVQALFLFYYWNYIPDGKKTVNFTQDTFPVDRIKSKLEGHPRAVSAEDKTSTETSNWGLTWLINISFGYFGAVVFIAGVIRLRKDYSNSICGIIVFLVMCLLCWRLRRLLFFIIDKIWFPFKVILAGAMLWTSLKLLSMPADDQYRLGIGFILLYVAAFWIFIIVIDRMLLGIEQFRHLENYKNSSVWLVGQVYMLGSYMMYHQYDGHGTDCILRVSHYVMAAFCFVLFCEMVHWLYLIANNTPKVDKAIPAVLALVGMELLVLIECNMLLYLCFGYSLFGKTMQWFDVCYYTVMTFTTVGYGDISPGTGNGLSSLAGQGMAVITSLLGMFTTAVMIGVILNAGESKPMEEESNPDMKDVLDSMEMQAVMMDSTDNIKNDNLWKRLFKIK